VKLRAHAVSIALVVLAAAALAYAWLVDRGSVTESEKEARAGRVFPAFRRDELSRMEIAHGQERVAIERNGDAWRMRAPYDVACDFAAVERLVHDLETATRVRKAEGSGGLDAPRAVVTIAMGKVTYRLALGGAAASPEGAAYARLDDGDAFVVRRELAAALLRGPETYRDRTIAPYGGRDIARLELGGARAQAAIERVDDVDFRVVGGARASRAIVEKLFVALADLRAEKFVDERAADEATRTPDITLRATPRDAKNAPIVLAFGGACPELATDVIVVRSEPAPRVAACVPKIIVDALAVRAESLPDKRVFSSHEDEIAELRIEAIPAGAVLEIARVGGGWHERAPDDRALVPDEAESANALAIALAHTSGAMVDSKLERAAFRARVVRAEGRGEEIVEVGAAEAGGTALVRRLGDGVVLRVAADDARRLAPRPILLKSTHVWSPSAESRPILRVATKCGAPQELVHGDDGWTMRAPRGYAADAAAALDLANAVARLRAIAWVADADDGHFGFERAACSVEIAIGGEDGGTRTLALSFGAPADGGVYARVDSRPEVLVAPRSLREMAASPMIDRGALAIDPTSDGATVAVRGASRVTLAPDAGAADALRTLRADRVVHLGAPAKDEGFASPTLELQAKTKRVTFGATTTIDAVAYVFARASGVDATFAVEKSKLEAILSGI
jgi:hypothetical protein